MNTHFNPSDTWAMPAAPFISRLFTWTQSRRAKYLFSFLIMAAVLVAMLAISWEKWGDTIVDTGREVYIPWQLSEGKVLYRDVYVNQYGPLSVYVNAGLFKLFGVRLMTLHIFNILLTIGVAACLYRIFLRASGFFVATINIVIFFGLFAFSDITSMGIFNFVAPYAYAVTYSLALALAVLYFLEKYGESKSNRHIFMAGLGIGLVFLCKYEAFVAITLCFLACLLFIYPPENGWRGKIKAAGIALAGFVIPFAGFLVYFSRFMTVKVAFASMMQQYRQIFESQVVNNPFYKMVAGTLEPLENLTSVGRSIIYWDLVAVIGLVCAFFFARIHQKAVRLAAAFIPCIGLTIFITVHALNEPYLWVHELLAGLPPILAIAVAIFIYPLLKKRNIEHLDKQKPLILFMLFSLGFIAKIALNVQAYHYGFVLAMPAALAGAWLLLDAFPRLVDRKFPGTRWIPASIGLIFIYGLLLSHFSLSAFSYSQKKLPVGEKNDRLITWDSNARNVYIPAFISTRERGVLFQQTLNELDKIMKPEDTLLVVPEGALFNYMHRRINPTPYTSFLLGDLVMFDECEMVRTLEQRPPSYIIVADRDLLVYGYRSFGIDTGRQIMDWISQNYLIVRQFGKTPFKSLGFGTQILRYSPGSIRN